MLNIRVHFITILITLSHHTFVKKWCKKMDKKIEFSPDESNEEKQSFNESIPEAQKNLYAGFATNCQTFHIPQLSDSSRIREKKDHETI